MERESMKYLAFTLLLIAGFVPGITFAQNEPEYSLDKAELEAHLRFLAADELQGRRTSENSNRVTASYIDKQLRSNGATPVSNQSTYSKNIYFYNTSAGGKGKLNNDGGERAFETDWILL